MTPVRQLRPDETFDLRETIRTTLARGEPVDPHDVATIIVGLLPNSEIDRLVRYAVVDLVRDELRLVRSAHRGSPATSRWQRHRVMVDGLGDRIFVAGQWESVATCTAEMLDAYAGEQNTRAEEIQAIAKRASDLAAELRAAGAATVADLLASREKAAA